MNYLSVEQLSKRYGERLLFSDLTFGINKGQKVALIARNGTGKSTLLKLIAREEAPDHGTVTFRNDIRVTFLKQAPVLGDHLTVGDVLFTSDNPAVRATRNYEAAVESANPDRIQQAVEQMDRTQAWDYETQVKQILTQLQVNQYHQPVGTLSGGQKRRLALAQAIIEEPDFLILDEPTNHLDLDMIEWLEEWLKNESLTLLMVTHDRYFLERVCDEILELEDQTIYRYKGSYAYFLEKKQEREELRQSEIAKAKNLMRKELDWMRRQPKARGTKSKARVDAFGDLQQTASQRMDEDQLSLQVNTQRLGGKVLELHSVRKQFDQLVLIDGFSYKFVKGERIGIVGPNGSGKSTLLNMILGIETPTSGTIKTGETVHFGYYSQGGLSFKSGKRVIEVVKDIAEYIPLKKGKTISAAQLLERFLFPREQHFMHVEKLSGGEKRRLYLLTVLMSNPNFLILDEPTNDLDVITLSVLEDFLQEFPGCLLVVTHDRFFMDRLTDHLFVFEGEGVIKDFPGNYSQYRDYREAKQKKIQKEEKSTLPDQSAPAVSGKEKTKLSYKEKREFEALSESIDQLEEQKTRLTQELNRGDLDHTQLQEKGEQLAEVLEQLEEKEMRWLELSEYAK